MTNILRISQTMPMTSMNGIPIILIVNTQKITQKTTPIGWTTCQKIHMKTTSTTTLNGSRMNQDIGMSMKTI